MRWFAVNTVLQKYQLSYIFMLLKNEDKRKQTGRKYSTPPCISIAGPGTPRELKVGSPRKRSITLSWKKPQRYGDDVQMYTVISLLLLFVASLLSLSKHYKTKLN